MVNDESTPGRLPAPPAVPAEREHGATTPPQPQTPWHALEPGEAAALLNSSADGLTSDEAAARLRIYGPNVVPRGAGDGPLRLLWRQINNPLIWVLIGAALIAVLLGKITDGLVVFAVVVLNTIIGFIQEYKASRAIEALMRMVPEFATVLRDGRRVSLAVAELVPGDAVALAAGDKVPADARIFGSRALKVEEAALTGESVPVDKSPVSVEATAAIGDRSGMVFGGTLVTYGSGMAMVVATGAGTELGRISTMLSEAVDPETPLTKALASIGRWIAVGIVSIALVMMVVATIRAVAVGIEAGHALGESIVFAIALAVGAIPEGLPAIVTIALAIGVQRMAARRAIIRKLPAVETLGSTTVIASDKTGTLTRNEMTVQEVWAGEELVRVTGVGYAPEGSFQRNGRDLPAAPDAIRELLLDAALCADATLLRGENGAWQIAGDPTEGALVVAAEKAGLAVDELRREHPRLDAIPFESESQFMATLHGGELDRRAILKGAPEVVLARSAVAPDGSPLDDAGRAAVLRRVDAMAVDGMRVLALADRPMADRVTALDHEDVLGGLRFRGLVGMIDPPRPEAIAAVAACHAAGITVKMITGDHRLTAQAIGREIGLGDDGTAVTGTELAAMEGEALRVVAGSANVFARVAPEHKLRLVRAIQADGAVVAMTGDGVNDAPALKQADIGVAMGITGTSVSKEAADIVLADDNFASIAAAVEEGRRVYDNLVKALAFVLPTNIGLGLILTAAVAFFPFAGGELLLPMAPTQLLWINLVAAVALALPLAFEAHEPDVMVRPPRDPRAPVLSGFVIFRTVLVATLMAGGAIGMFTFAYSEALALGASRGGALAEAQTMAVTTVILFQIFYLLNCRSLRDSLLRIGLLSNPTVYLGIAVVVVLQAAFIYGPPLQAIFGTRPLDPRDLALAAIVGSLILPVISIEKMVRSRRARNAARPSGGQARAATG
jgi:Ca2+-transporting ATPase